MGREEQQRSGRLTRKMRESATQQQWKTAASVPPFLGSMAPWWALYSLGVLILGILTGFIGWFTHRGMRLFAAITQMVGVGMLLGAGGLRWQQSAWRGRARAWARTQPRQITRIIRRDRRISLGIRSLAGTGMGVFVVGIWLAARWWAVLARWGEHPRTPNGGGSD